MNIGIFRFEYWAIETAKYSSRFSTSVAPFTKDHFYNISAKQNYVIKVKYNAIPYNIMPDLCIVSPVDLFTRSVCWQLGKKRRSCVQASEAEAVCLGDKGQHGQWQGSIPDVATEFYNIQIWILGYSDLNFAISKFKSGNDVV